MLIDDSPERIFDEYEREDLPTATLEDADAEDTSKPYESEAISKLTEKPKPNRTPRREVWWLDLGTTNQSLESIKRCFENYLDRFPSSLSDSLLRIIKPSKDKILRRNLHQCPGYVREEITLTSDVSRSAIVSHAFPSESELCSICGQLVQYTYLEPSVNDKEIGPVGTNLQGTNSIDVLDCVDNYDIGSSLERPLNVPSVLLQRQQGQSFASSSESSLSSILTNDNVADPNMTTINADSPFSINQPPSIPTMDHEDFSFRGLVSPGPVSADTRNRGDSLSSDSSTSNPQLSFTSGSGTNQLVATPGNASIFPQDSDKTMPFVHDEVLEPAQDYKGGLNERRAQAPLDIDITSISSHAEAEALVERARREALDWVSTSDFSPLSSGTGRSPLSARLAAYGESLALERKLREQMEQRESTWKEVQSLNAPSPVLSPLTSIPILKGPDGVERQLSLEDNPGIERVGRHKDPRRPSTADAGTFENF